ncbi:MAG: beta-lactamase family protein [Xanthomonadales bacterium]|nr:beta-lactamase family protein [Xanthomonadales bacterium]MDH4020518.1 beta-lactamase family protein [Xanthomonadales bacterium]
MLETSRIEMKMPGLRAAVRLSDGRIVCAATGFADKESNAPLDNDIGMPGGSTGKTFVAALTMLLIEDGRLSLDDMASKWLGHSSWFSRLPNAREIRVRHLLSHSAGILDYIDTAKFQFSMIGRVIRDGSAYYEPEELIEFVLDKKPLFSPGEGYHYTDAGYLVLGRLIEAVSGKNYYSLLSERILVPQQLDEVHPADKSVLTNIATGYMGGGRNLKKDGRMKFDPRSEWTGGGLVTNPTMLVKFYGALVDELIVTPEGLSSMLESGWQNPESPGTHYGFGLFVYDYGASFGHGGLWPGYRTHVTHFVPSGLTVAVQTNRDGRLDLEALITRIATLILSMPPELEG